MAQVGYLTAAASEKTRNILSYWSLANILEARRSINIKTHLLSEKMAAWD